MQHGWISFPSTILRKYQRNIISLGRSSQHSALSHKTAIETFIHRKSSLPLPLQTTDFWWHLLWYESRTPKEAGVGTGWWGLCSPLVRTVLVGIHCLLCSKEVGCSWEAERNTLLLSTMNQNALAALLWTQASFHPTDLQYKPLQSSCCSRGMESSAFSSTHSLFIQRWKLNQKLCQLSDPACFLAVRRSWLHFRKAPMTKSCGLFHTASQTPKGIPGFKEISLCLSSQSYSIIDLPH